MTEYRIDELKTLADRDLGTSRWLRIEQQRISQFAQVTEDQQWIHVDPERAESGPFGSTIAHGYLTLSLIPSLLSEIMTVTDIGLMINLGVDRLRFTTPVRSGSEIRLRAKLLSSESTSRGLFLRVGAEIEVRGQDRPALAAELLYLASPDRNAPSSGGGSAAA